MKKFLLLALISTLAFSSLAFATEVEEDRYVSTEPEDVIMSDEDVALISQYSDAWWTAYQASDTEAMEENHAKAEAIRATYNITGGKDGTATTSLYEIKVLKSDNISLSLYFDIFNNSNENIYLNNAYILEHLVDGEWVYVEPADEKTFVSATHKIAPGGCTTMGVTFYHYGRLSTGTYRFVKELTTASGETSTATGSFGLIYMEYYELNAKNSYVSNLPMIVNFDLVNNTNDERTYGNAYTLQMYDGESWIEVEPTEDLIFTEELYTLAPNSTNTFSINLANYSDLQDGVYRIVKDDVLSYNIYGIFVLTSDIQTVGEILSIEDNKVDILTGDLAETFEVSNASDFEVADFVMVIEIDGELSLVEYNL